MQLISPTNGALRYTGRIDFTRPEEPTLIYAGTSIHVRFSGTFAGIRVRNVYHDYESSVGYSIDGTEGKAVLPKDGDVHDITLASGLSGGMHDLVLWKRMAGGNHYIDFLALLVDDGATVSPLGVRPERRIECYGDSVSAGEVCEAVEYAGKPDPEGHEGRYSNSWHSFSMMTARKLGAEIHNVAQGGIAVLDGTGWFVSGKVGLESTWNKLRYNVELGPYTDWDFSLWTPHVVIMALGQNDSHPDDYVNVDPVRRKKWIDGYALIIRKIRAKYPRALIVVITTLLMHDAGWDAALDEMTQSLGDERVVRYRFARNGCGTPGHLRLAENEEMAGELTSFIESFGESVWQ